MSSQDEKKFPSWEQFYQRTEAEEMPWYWRELEPDIEEALNELGVDTGRILDLGTGPGTQAMALARRGFRVTATDISETAVKLARARAEKQGQVIDWKQDDILDSTLTGPFDLIFDRGCFHVLSPKDRRLYTQIIARLLVPTGLLLLKTFSDEESGADGPHRFAPAQLEDCFAENFETLFIRKTVFQGNLRPLPRALFGAFRKR